MFKTNKNEIIESICKDLKGTSYSALARLAETFGVPYERWKKTRKRKLGTLKVKFSRDYNMSDEEFIIVR